MNETMMVNDVNFRRYLCWVSVIVFFLCLVPASLTSTEETSMTNVDSNCKEISSIRNHALMKVDPQPEERGGSSVHSHSSHDPKSEKSVESPQQYAPPPGPPPEYHAELLEKKTYDPPPGPPPGTNSHQQAGSYRYQPETHPGPYVHQQGTPYEHQHGIPYAYQTGSISGRSQDIQNSYHIEQQRPNNSANDDWWTFLISLLTIELCLECFLSLLN